MNIPYHLHACGIAIALVIGGTLSAVPVAPLADAVEGKDHSATRTLLKQKADVNASQVDGMTALHWAAYQDDLKTTKLLLKGGANVEVKNRYSVTPLSLACLNGNGEMVELFLEAGADPNTTLTGGEPVLMTAARTGKVPAVKALLASGADVNAKGRRKQTALMWAAAEGNSDVVHLLLEAGADFRAQIDSGFTPLLFAVREGRAAVVHALLKAGLDVNEPVDPAKPSDLAKGVTPLMMAVENGHFELAVDLLKAGADPNDLRLGYTALHALINVRKPPSGDDKFSIPPPLGSGNLSSLQFVRELIKHGADINKKRNNSVNKSRGGKGATAFFEASATADAPYMRLLVALGADPLITNAANSTPLMVAAGVGTKLADSSAGTESEILEVAQLLLDLGVDIDAVDNNGETAMHGAAYKNLPGLVQFLDDHGAKIEIWHKRNKKGSTPYLIAAGYRPGNFKVSAETMAAIKEVMHAHGKEPTEKPPKQLDQYGNKDKKAKPDMKTKKKAKSDKKAPKKAKLDV